MTTHDLKCWPEPFGLVAAGIKRHEVRHNDRDYAVGDVLRLREWRKEPNAVGSGTFTGRVVEAVVGHMTRAGPPPVLGLLALGTVVMDLVNVRELPREFYEQNGGRF